MSTFSCKNKHFKRTLFVLLCMLNFSDFIADWLLYVSVSRSKKGLVYGQASLALQNALLSFAIIGSVLFPVEIYNAWLKIFRNKPFVNVDVMSAFVVWFNDVPQTIINVIIAACREELVSNFQIFKGSVVIFVCALRLMLFFIRMIRYCRTERGKKTRDKSRWRLAVKFVVGIGAISAFIGSVAVFIFSQYHLENGVLQPYNSQRYFKNVGIFVDPNVIYPGGNLTNSNLIKICTIQDAMLKDSNCTVRYRLESGTNSPRLTIAKQLGSKSFQVTQCFRMSLSPELKVTSELTVNSCNDVTTANADDTVFRFQYKLPDSSLLTSIFLNRHIFGEIYFNVGRSFTNATLTLTHGGVGGPLGYFRYQPAISGQQDLVFPLTSLGDIRQFWKTGYFKCDSSGSLSPISDSNLTIASTYFQ